MEIGDAVRFRADSPRRHVLGPVGHRTGIVVDVAVVDGIETLSVVFGDNRLLETDDCRRSARSGQRPFPSAS